MKNIGAGLFAIQIAACASLSPPVAPRETHVRDVHGLRVEDSYYWMRHRKDPRVLNYLRAENSYAAKAMTKAQPLIDELYQEMVSRLSEDDESVPVRWGNYLYYTKNQKGRSYKLHFRKPVEGGKEQLLLDENELAEGKKYFRLRVFEPSPDHTHLAFSADYDGSEAYVLEFKNIATGKIIGKAVDKTAGSVAWANDSRTIFYSTIDAMNRPHKVFRHTLGTEEYAEVFHEPDERYYLGLSKTHSERFVRITLKSAITTEIHILDAGDKGAPLDPKAKFAVVTPRKQGIEYYLEHHGERFFIHSNENALNFQLLEAPIADPKKENWKVVMPHRDDVTLGWVEPFKNYLVVFTREAGLPSIRIRRLTGEGAGQEHKIELPEVTYEIRPEENPEFETDLLRFRYSSLVTPRTIFDYDMSTKKRTALKQDDVQGHDPARYVSDRIFATSRDGTKIPISTVRHRNTQLSNKAPLLLVAYGSYGAPWDARFDARWVSFLDRGFVIAIAHVRGGGELGRAWKDAGMLEKKKTTFEDFVDCTEHLRTSGHGSGPIAIAGGSAGGLLVGSVINMRADLYDAAVARVPFVDLINTLLDETIPLTVTDWEDFGNPNEKAWYDVLAAYAPYENVRAQNYPHLLVMTGINDPRVAYWEPAKWVAKLRSTKTDTNKIFFKTNLNAGHACGSDRYACLREDAYEYAFVIEALANRL